MTYPVITAEGLCKRYSIGRQRSKRDGMRHVIEQAVRAPFERLRGNGNGKRSPTQEFWALQDVSLEVWRGEVVGIIGRNGAGKSTLLKVLSRITEPTRGRVRIRGRVASLLEVGTGFHPELTGRENIYLNGAILGMKRTEIRRKFAEIVEFAGIEMFLDTPVKRYSSGMYVRLAFAVAAHLEPEILIVDEVLAVGDAEFQRKCLKRMDAVAREEGRTVLFVSHNMAAISNLCTSCILLASGRVAMRGTTEQVTSHYLTQALDEASGTSSLAARQERSGNGDVRLTRFHLEDREGNDVRFAVSGLDLTMVFGFTVADGKAPRNVDVGVSISTTSGQLLCVHYCSYQGTYLDPVTRSGEFRFRCERLPLSAGRYIVGGRVVVDRAEADWPYGGVGVLDVEAGDFYGAGRIGFGGAAPFLVDGSWTMAEAGNDPRRLHAVCEEAPA